MGNGFDCAGVHPLSTRGSWGEDSVRTAQGGRGIPDGEGGVERRALQKRGREAQAPQPLPRSLATWRLASSTPLCAVFSFPHIYERREHVFNPLLFRATYDRDRDASLSGPNGPKSAGIVSLGGCGPETARSCAFGRDEV
eukprot:3532396-Prymnesium_polylepis.1